MRPRRPYPARGTGRAPPGAVLAALLLAALLGGCGGAVHERVLGQGADLLVGQGGPDPAGLAGAVGLAQSFARHYAHSAYRRRAAGVREEDATVRRALVAAATRVPPARRGLRPRLLGLRLWPRSERALDVSARIGDGRHPPFSVGFTVSRRQGRWLVTSISLPD